MNCYLSRNYKGTSTSGDKAKTDMEILMESWGFKNIGLKRSFHSNKALSFILTLTGVVKGCFSIKKGDTLFLQYPLKKYFCLICNLVHLKGGKVIILIHDLGCFRRKKLTVAQEMKKLSHADYIIATNPSMKEWLARHQCMVPTGSLGIWDYLSESNTPDLIEKFTSPYIVMYAGALSKRKNRFLYDWGEVIENYRVSIYGHGLEENKIKNKERFSFRGFVNSDRLIESAEGHFGLVWDGDSVNSCNGNWGEYLKYNTPHKVSLYIRCGLPIIIWKNAALAPFVLENNIGLCIDKLEDLNKVFGRLSCEEYCFMKRNVLEISKRLSQGYYFQRAVLQARGILSLIPKSGKNHLKDY